MQFTIFFNQNRNLFWSIKKKKKHSQKSLQIWFALIINQKRKQCQHGQDGKSDVWWMHWMRKDIWTEVEDNEFTELLLLLLFATPKSLLQTDSVQIYLVLWELAPEKTKINDYRKSNWYYGMPMKYIVIWISNLPSRQQRIWRQIITYWLHIIHYSLFHFAGLIARFASPSTELRLFNQRQGRI